MALRTMKLTSVYAGVSFIMQDEKIYKTSDLGVGAAWLASGAFLHHLEPIDERRVSFVFHGTGLDEIEKCYWQRNMKLDALSHFDAIKQLKNRLYGQRN